VKRARRRSGKARSHASEATAEVARPQAAETSDGGATPDPISFSDLSLHELFEQQARHMLENADIDEEQKQSILVAMACPCCGAGGMSFSVKLKKP
jgi:hypothetical protein